jgi:hypothetical protein
LSEEEYLNRTNNYLESFHGHLNQILQCYHPKISYLINKYKIYLINLYEKIKSNLVNNNSSENNEKFSIIGDILKFVKNYNNKYKTNININLILQSSEDEKETINKICNYILDFYFDINGEEEDLQIEDNNLNNEFIDEIKLENKEENSDNDESKELNFDEFFPRVLPKKIKKKRNYNELENEPNELKKFWEIINFNRL